MIPTTQLKMLRYMRSAEPKGGSNGSNGNSGNNGSNGNGGSNGSNGSSNNNNVGLVSPKLPSQQPGTLQSPPQPPQPQLPPPLTARQLLAEAAKIPVPSALRGTTPGYSHAQPIAPAAGSPKRQQQQQQLQQIQTQQTQQAQQTQLTQQTQRRPSFQRARSNSDHGRAPPVLADLAQQQIWEDSSINSMFAESVATTALPQRTNLGRFDNPLTQQRGQLHHERAASEKGDRADRADRAEDVSGPYIVNDRGILRIMPTNGAGETLTARAADPFVERTPFGSPPRHVPALKHSKYALRDSRAASRRPSFSNQEDIHGGGRSPEHQPQYPPQRAHQRGETLTKALAADGLLGQDAGKPTSAFFRDTNGPPPHRRVEMDDDHSDAPSQGDEATNQRTPRQNHPPQGPPPQKMPPAVPQKRGLLESSVSRTAGRFGGGGGEADRRDHHGKTTRKRRHSPDYDDGVLHAMTYTELLEEPFDHDPTRAAVQRTVATTPPKLTLEEQLVQNKTKDENSQHRFFTEMKVQEWDECGDWFLTQFAELSNQIRQKRLEKRKKVAEFEAEIADREKMVRVKMDNIDRTLATLRHEGEGMMRGKSVDI